MCFDSSRQLCLIQTFHSDLAKSASAARDTFSVEAPSQHPYNNTPDLCTGTPMQRRYYENLMKMSPKKTCAMSGPTVV